MPGKWITSRQLEIYMNARKQGYTQEVASAKSGISVRSGREIDHGKRQLPQETSRHWRTRRDPLESVWESELVPLLTESPELQPITLLEYLQSSYPGKYEDTVLRTLQRRVKRWRATAGPAKDVMFRQQHEPGRQGLSDFTQLKGVRITIKGQCFNHLLYHFRLIYSKWSYMRVVLGGESYSALAEGLSEALHRLGGAPRDHRTDSLSAAYKNLSTDEQVDVTTRYEALCQHYGMQASRNNRGKGHENGGVESPHGHLKRRIEQALILRKSCDFDSIEAYQTFIDNVVQQHNKRNATAIKLERPALQPLPTNPAITYTEIRAVVSSSSTIDVRRVTYTVPSRLQGETLHIRLHDDRLICHLGSEYVLTLPRIYPKGKTQRAQCVNYRHVIDSLVKKPQAFRYSKLRDALLPNLGYHAIWAYVNLTMEPRAACRFIVGLLHLAATADCERPLAQAVLEMIDDNEPLVLSKLQQRFKPTGTATPTVSVEQHSLNTYNVLLQPTSTQEHAHV